MLLNPLTLAISLAAGAVMAAAEPTGFFKPVVPKSFINLDFQVDYTENITNPIEGLSVTRNLGGNVTGSFEGTILPIAASVERINYNTTGLGVAQYSEYTNDLVLVRNGDEARVFASLIGTVKYANGGIHGFAYAKLETTIDEFQWINYAHFVAEWTAVVESGTGLAKVEFWEIQSGGRTDGEPQLALEPSADPPAKYKPRRV